MKRSSAKSSSKKRCLKHDDEYISIFCEDHDVVCCTVCKADEHNACIKSKPLSDATKGIQLSREKENTKMATMTFLTEVGKVLSDRRTDIPRIAKEKELVKQTIADVRKKVNNYFDNLEQKCLADLDVREKRIVSTLEEDTKYLATAKTKAENIIKELESFKEDNECELFVQVKMSKHTVHEAMKKVHGISTDVGKNSLQFNINPEIEKYLSSLESLGTFTVDEVASTHTGSTAVKPKLSSLSSATQACSSPKTDHYQVQLFGRYLEKEKSDKYACSIANICQSPDGDFFIIDDNNNKLKRLSKDTYKVIDSFQLSDIPSSVCAVGSEEAAVSLCLKRQIQIVPVKRKLEFTRSRFFSTKNNCRGIAYMNQKLYICCGISDDSPFNCIEVYHRIGRFLHCIPHVSQHLSSVPDNITISDDGKHFFVTSYGKNDIIMLDLAGNVVNTFTDKELSRPIGICTDGQGHVLVSGYNSNTVHQITPEKQTIQVIMRGTDGVKNPQGICYDSVNSMLLLSSPDYLLTFTLKKNIDQASSQA